MNPPAPPTERPAVGVSETESGGAPTGVSGPEEQPSIERRESRSGPEVLLEVVVQSVADALAAEAGGAKRLELCSGLVDGGLTPPATLIEAVVAAVDLPVFVLIRPRGGDFVLDDDDLELMRADVRAAGQAGASGVVVGALTPEGDVDVPRLARLIATARPMELTFHRAFDHAREPLAAYEALRTLGVDRVLTSGQAVSAARGADLIAQLVALDHARPIVIAGGGVRASNVARLVAETQVSEVHSSAAGHRPSPAKHINDKVPLGPTQPSVRRGVEVTEVRALLAALSV